MKTIKKQKPLLLITLLLIGLCCLTLIQASLSASTCVEGGCECECGGSCHSGHIRIGAILFYGCVCGDFSEACGGLAI